MNELLAALRGVLNRRWVHWPLAALLGSVGGYLVAVILFPAPLTPDQRSVERVYGLPIEDAEAILERQGFRTKVGPAEPDPVLPAGRVIWQDPVAFTNLPAGGTVHLVASAGPPDVPVPDLIGFETAEAIRLLETTGFRVGAVDSIAAGAEAGVVVATRPGAGTGRTLGDRVDVVVSRGPATIRVPDLVGLTLQEARARLQAAGLRIGAIRPRTAGEGDRVLVTEQRPRAGILSPRDAAVNLVVEPREGF